MKQYRQQKDLYLLIFACQYFLFNSMDCEAKLCEMQKIYYYLKKYVNNCLRQEVDNHDCGLIKGGKGRVELIDTRSLSLIIRVSRVSCTHI